MTRAKEVETETFDGAGATAGLMLKRKPNSKSGYYGVIPNGKGWRARVYKPTKKKWDSIGTYTSHHSARNRYCCGDRGESRWRRAAANSTPWRSSELPPYCHPRRCIPCLCHLPIPCPCALCNVCKP